MVDSTAVRALLGRRRQRGQQSICEVVETTLELRVAVVVVASAALTSRR